MFAFSNLPFRLAQYDHDAHILTHRFLLFFCIEERKRERERERERASEDSTRTEMPPPALREKAKFSKCVKKVIPLLLLPPATHNFLSTIKLAKAVCAGRGCSSAVLFYDHDRWTTVWDTNDAEAKQHGQTTQNKFHPQLNPPLA